MSPDGLAKYAFIAGEMTNPQAADEDEDEDEGVSDKYFMALSAEYFTRKLMSLTASFSPETNNLICCEVAP